MTKLFIYSVIIQIFSMIYCTGIAVAVLNRKVSIIQNDNVVEDTPGTTDYSNFLFYTKNLFVSKARLSVRVVGFLK
jgi:hypothetical protein